MEGINKILIIDDSAEDQAVYRRYLTRSFGDSLEIVVYSSGVTGLTYLTENAVDCILLDYQLPDMTGTDILKEIVENKKSEAPVIMLTGQGNEKVATEAFKFGASDYLVKNDLDQQILHKTITNVIEKLAQSTKIREQEAKIKFMAYHDYLTGVSNRVHFEELARASLARAIRYKKMMAIYIIDLDRFKNVNDTLGHEAGDLLLKEVTRRFLSVIREVDTLARLGGDEFAVIADTLASHQDSEILADKLLESLKQPFNLLGHKIHVSASIGIALYPDAGDTLSMLSRNADIALYKAKEKGRNAWCVYTPKLNLDVTNDFHIENFIRDAIVRNKFCLSYQPIYNLGGDELYAIEALLRWQDAAFTNFTTEQVIQVAETSGLIVQIGNFVIETALKQFSEWKKKYKNGLKLSVNLSPTQLIHKGYIENFQNLLQSANLDPSDIIFEITEMAIIKDLPSLIDSLNEFHAMGCLIFIDDFGTGYSGVNTILNYPISGLKIDKSFVQNINGSPKNSELLKLIFLLADALHLVVVTEGVETKDHIDIIKSFSAAQKVQGYYFSRAITAEKMQELLESLQKVSRKG